MIRTLLKAAHSLDGWLHEKLGRPYGVLLSSGLAMELVHRITEIPEKTHELHRLLPLAGFFVLNAALLIHQLGELGERAAARRARRGEPAR